MKNPGSLSVAILLGSIVLLCCSVARHLLFHSNAFDLGFFDQAVYLISRGKTPVVSFVGYHILGDHAAFIFYPLALFYKIYPSVYWLLLIQAISLSLGALPLWQLSRQAGVPGRRSLAVAIAYLLYPLVFNVNLFDFHPETIAVPALFWAVLAARAGRFGRFCLLLPVILACKAILSLTVVGMGFWLFWFEKKRRCGAVAVASGTLWFALAAEVFVPLFTGKDAAAEMADARYSYLGDTVGEIIGNLFLRPERVFSHLFTGANLEYALLLTVPLVWGLRWRSLAPLTAALPALALNLLADYSPQKNLTTQYSLPILPFLFLAAIATLSRGGGWLREPKFILLWATVSFVALAKYGYFGSLYLSTLDTWRATGRAIASVRTGGGVLTTSRIAPHLTHRENVGLAIEGSENLSLLQFDYILLDRRHPGWSSSPELVERTIARLRDRPEFTPVSERDGVSLWIKRDET